MLLQANSLCGIAVGRGFFGEEGVVFVVSLCCFFFFMSVFSCISPGLQAPKPLSQLHGHGQILVLCPSSLSIIGPNNTDFLDKVL